MEGGGGMIDDKWYYWPCHMIDVFKDIQAMASKEEENKAIKGLKVPGYLYSNAQLQVQFI